MGYIVIVIIGILWCISWNKYYFPRKQAGRPYSFGGYLHWVADKFNSVPENEYKETEETKFKNGAHKDGNRWVHNYEEPAETVISKPTTKPHKDDYERWKEQRLKEQAQRNNKEESHE